MVNLQVQNLLGSGLQSRATGQQQVSGFLGGKGFKVKKGAGGGGGSGGVSGFDDYDDERQAELDRLRRIEQERIRGEQEAQRQSQLIQERRKEAGQKQFEIKRGFESTTAEGILSGIRQGVSRSQDFKSPIKSFFGGETKEEIIQRKTGEILQRTPPEQFELIGGMSTIGGQEIEFRRPTIEQVKGARKSAKSEFGELPELERLKAQNIEGFIGLGKAFQFGVEILPQAFAGGIIGEGETFRKQKDVDIFPALSKRQVGIETELALIAPFAVTKIGGVGSLGANIGEFLGGFAIARPKPGVFISETIPVSGKRGSPLILEFPKTAETSEFFTVQRREALGGLELGIPNREVISQAFGKTITKGDISVSFGATATQTTGVAVTPSGKIFEFPAVIGQEFVQTSRVLTKGFPTEEFSSFKATTLFKSGDIQKSFGIVRQNREGDIIGFKGLSGTSRQDRKLFYGLRFEQPEKSDLGFEIFKGGKSKSGFGFDTKQEQAIFPKAQGVVNILGNIPKGVQKSEFPTMVGGKGDVSLFAGLGLYERQDLKNFGFGTEKQKGFQELKFGADFKPSKNILGTQEFDINKDINKVFGGARFAPLDLGVQKGKTAILDISGFVPRTTTRIRQVPREIELIGNIFDEPIIPTFTGFDFGYGRGGRGRFGGFGFLQGGDLFGDLGQAPRPKRRLRRTPSLVAIEFGITAPRVESRLAEELGLAIRPILKRGRRKKRK